MAGNGGETTGWEPGGWPDERNAEWMPAQGGAAEWEQSPYVPPFDPGAPPPEKKPGGQGLYVVLGVLIALVLVGGTVLGVSLVLQRGSDDGAQAAGTESSGSRTGTATVTTSGTGTRTERSTRTRTTRSTAPSTTSTSRPARADVPEDAIPVGTHGRNGRLANVWRGTPITSEPFAVNVGALVKAQYDAIGEIPTELLVDSPVTGETYEMTCTDRLSYVVCRGGNNAVVYVS